MTWLLLRKLCRRKPTRQLTWALHDDFGTQLAVTYGVRTSVSVITFVATSSGSATYVRVSQPEIIIKLSQAKLVARGDACTITINDPYALKAALQR